MKVPDGDCEDRIFVIKGNAEAAGEKPRNWMPKDSPEMERRMDRGGNGCRSSFSLDQGQVVQQNEKHSLEEMCLVEDRGDLWGWFQVMFVEIPGYGEFKANGVWDLRAKGGNTTGC